MRVVMTQKIKRVETADGMRIGGDNGQPNPSYIQTDVFDSVTAVEEVEISGTATTTVFQLTIPTDDPLNPRVLQYSPEHYNMVVTN